MLSLDTTGGATLLGSASALGGGVYLAIVRIGTPSGPFHAMITSATQQGNAARWLYGWTEVRFSTSSSSWQQPSAGRSSTAYGDARNVLEAANTSSTAYSIPVNGETFTIDSTGVRFRPVPVNVVVEMHLVSDAQGGFLATFSAPNPVWGPCTPLAGLVGSDTSSGAQPVEGSAEQESETGQ